MKNMTTFASSNLLIGSENQYLMIDDLNNQTDELEELLDRIEAKHNATTMPIHG